MTSPPGSAPDGSAPSCGGPGCSRARARWFSGQSDYARPAIARRLREGGRPNFPPGLRDAPLLGASVIDLLAKQEGERAAAQFVTRLHPQGARAAITKAFGDKPFVHIEGDWRSHLARLASAS